MNTWKKTAAGLTVLLALSATAACGDDEETTTTPGTDSSSTDGNMSDAGSDLVGKGCAAYAEANASGPASIDGMALEPVATAASANPLVSTLVAAVSGEVNKKVNLVETLNSAEAITVFAPVNDAFTALGNKTLKAVSKPKNADLLTSVLTYHVVEGRITPDQIAGEQTTLQGGTVNVTGEGESLKFNDANLICGGVKTANATVYLIDGVLMPPA